MSINDIFCSVISSSNSVVKNGRMTIDDNELERIWKEGKGKAVLLQAWGGPEGSRKVRFPDFLTMAQDVGKVVSLMHQLHLPPGNTPGTHFC
jgi:hypothetical protein